MKPVQTEIMYKMTGKRSSVQSLEAQAAVPRLETDLDGAMWRLELARKGLKESTELYGKYEDIY